MGISYATAEVGGSHLRGWPETTDPPSESALDTIESMIESRDQKILKDSLIQCHFTFRIPLSFKQNIELLNAATGLNYDEESLYTFARRVETLNRMFNIREGITRQDDVLPPRFWEPEPSGPREGMKSFVDYEDFERCLDHFYELRGWDNNGQPTIDTMQELNLVPTHFSKPSWVE